MKRIELTQGRVAVVDSEDYEELNKYNWQARVQTYTGLFRAKRSENKKEIDMAREIMNCPPGLEVDHINGDLLDNRKCNLRICTHGENMRNRRLQRNNTSGYRGVHYFKRDGRYVAYIYLNGRKIHIGSYKTDIDAAMAYNAHARDLHGEFARLNDI